MTLLRRSSVLVPTAVGLAALLAPIAAPVADALPPPTVVTVTGYASENTSGVPVGYAGSASLSDTGRYLAFVSTATGMVAGVSSGGHKQVYVRDRLAGTTVLASESSGGQVGNADSHAVSISRTGRYVAFSSDASNLVSGDTNGHADVFVRDLALGTTVRVSLANGGSTQANADSIDPVISATGSSVLFASTATNLVAGDTNAKLDLFLRAVGGTSTQRVDVASGGGQLSAGVDPGSDAMSGDARYIAFEADTTEVGDASNNITKVLLRDRTAGTTEVVSRNDGGDELTGGASQFPTVSDDGRYVGFETRASNLLPLDLNGSADDSVVRDRTGHHTYLVSQTTGGIQGNAGSGSPVLSANGLVATYESSATNLAAGTTGADTVFVRDIAHGVTTLGSASTSGAVQNSLSIAPTVSADGTTIAFETWATNLGTPTPATSDVIAVRGPIVLGPFASAGPLVTQNTKDFLGRSPTGAELTAGQAAINAGGVDPAHWINSLAHGSYASYRAPVIRLYWAFFKRLPDAGGLAYWLSQYQGGRSLASIADFFATSTEFKSTYGSNTTNTQFVTLVYQNVLGRSPDAAGLSYWVGQLGSGVHRGAMLVGFSESAEGKALRRPEVDTVLLYGGMLRRLPTATEFTTWTTYLHGTSGALYRPSEELVESLLESSTYAVRFP